MVGLGAHGHAHTDFARALSNRHQQDVHDADPSHQQGDRGNRGEQGRHHLAGAGRGFSNVLQIAHAKIIFLTCPEMVTLPQEVLHFLLRLVSLVSALS